MIENDMTETDRQFVDKKFKDIGPDINLLIRYWWKSLQLLNCRKIALNTQILPDVPSLKFVHNNYYEIID
jgi:hypothetical protein